MGWTHILESVKEWSLTVDTAPQVKEWASTLGGSTVGGTCSMDKVEGTWTADTNCLMVQEGAGALAGVKGLLALAAADVVRMMAKGEAVNRCKVAGKIQVMV